MSLVLRLLVSALISTAGYAQLQNVRSLLIKVGSQEPEIVRSTPGTHEDLQEVHRLAAKKETRGGEYTVHYHSKGRTVKAATWRDPRVLRGDKLSAKGELSGGFHRMEEGYIPVTVPADASHVTVSSAELSHTMEVPETHAHSKFQTLEVTSREIINVQLIGKPSTHKNLVFVSAGFDSKERAKFVTAVTKCVEFLKGESPGTLMPSPWDRYMSLINVWAVFQPEATSGVSYPMAADGSGGLNGVEVIKKNNLGCDYGTTIQGFLSCDHSRVQTLGSYAPPDVQKTTYIVLVNEETYGGSGGNKVAVVYTGNQMLRVLIHELAHADADLSDEFSYGVDEPQNYDLKNCAYNAEGTPWLQWMGDNAPSGLGVGSPVLGCGHANYYRPTESQCLMNTERSGEFCAVCAENQIRAIYEELVDLASPRCPQENEVIILTPDSYVNLAANREFFDGVSPKFDYNGITWPRHVDGTKYRYDNGPIDVSWHTTIGKAPAFGYNYTVTGAELGVGDHVVFLTISDRSLFVNSPRAGPLAHMAYETQFHIRVINPATDIQFEFCNNGYLDSIRHYPVAPEVGPPLNKCPASVSPDGKAFYYCAMCKEGEVCNNTYYASPITPTAYPSAASQYAEDVMFAVGIAMVSVGAIVFFVIAFLTIKRSSSTPREIVALPKVMKAIQIVGLVMNPLLMLFSVGFVVMCIWVYYDAAAFAVTSILAGLCLACVLWIASFVGFIATVRRNFIMLAVNAITCLALVVVLTVLSLYWYDIGNDYQSAASLEAFREHWMSLLARDEAIICDFEIRYSCSGFISSCFSQNSSECPKSCPIANINNPTPCFYPFRYRQYQLYHPTGLACMVLVACLWLAILCNGILCTFVRKRNIQKEKRLKSVVPGLSPDPHDRSVCELAIINAIRNLTRNEKASLKGEFCKVHHGIKKLNARQFKHFIQEALNLDFTVDDVQRLMYVMDKNGDGLVDWDEFMAMGETMLEQKERDLVMTDPKVAHIDKKTIGALYDLFMKMDVDDDKLITIKDVRTYYKQLYKVEANPRDLRSALQALNHNGSDYVTVIQFIQMFAAAQQRTLKAHAESMSNLPTNYFTNTNTSTPPGNDQGTEMLLQMNPILPAAH